MEILPMLFGLLEIASKTQLTIFLIVAGIGAILWAMRNNGFGSTSFGLLLLLIGLITLYKKAGFSFSPLPSNSSKVILKLLQIAPQQSLATFFIIVGVIAILWSVRNNGRMLTMIGIILLLSAVYCVYVQAAF